MVIDVIGTMYDVTDPENPIAQSGWHVNTPQAVDGWDSYRVKPSTPSRVFLGVDEVYCYKFDSKEQFESQLEMRELDL